MFALYLAIRSTTESHLLDSAKLHHLSFIYLFFIFFIVQLHVHIISYYKPFIGYGWEDLGAISDASI